MPQKSPRGASAPRRSDEANHRNGDASLPAARVRRRGGRRLLSAGIVVPSDLASLAPAASRATESPPTAVWRLFRHACGFQLANQGTDTRTLQAYLGHRNIQHTVRYTELSPTRFKNLRRD